MTAGSSLSFVRPHIGSVRAALAAWLPAAIPFVFGALLTGLVAADHGGYWPTTWGWTTLALAWVAVVALVLGEGRPGGFELAWIAGLAAVTGWTAVTWLWTASQTQTALEVERTLTYLAVVIAAAAVVRRSGVEALVWGVWLGTTLVSLYALLTRLLPNRIGVTDTLAGYRLATPVGYWNGLGLVAAIATLLGVGLFAHGGWLVRPRGRRARRCRCWCRRCTSRSAAAPGSPSLRPSPSSSPCRRGGFGS